MLNRNLPPQAKIFEKCPKLKKYCEYWAIFKDIQGQNLVVFKDIQAQKMKISKDIQGQMDNYFKNFEGHC